MSLQVLEQVGVVNKNMRVRCLCECGKEFVALSNNVKRGLTKTCGHTRGHTIRHGDARGGKTTPEYNSWAGMHQRCKDPGSHKYPDYGGRGIKVCERWDRFEAFLDDMGRKPSRLHSIDRIDVNGNYEPANCRWATPKQQSANRRPAATWRRK